MLLERNNNTIHPHKLCLQNYRRVPVSIGLVVLNPEKEKGRHEIKPTIKLSFKGCGQHITQTGHPSPNTIIIRFRSDSSRAHARAEPTTCRTASIRKLCRDKHTHTSERRNVYDKNCPAKGAEGESITGLNRTHTHICWHSTAAPTAVMGMQVRRCTTFAATNLATLVRWCTANKQSNYKQFYEYTDKADTK